MKEIDVKIQHIIELGVYGLPYVQYYSHEQADCFKADKLNSEYLKDTMVLCKVSEGFSKAIEILLEISLPKE